jgi:hypothetical protein
MIIFELIINVWENISNNIVKILLVKRGGIVR